MPARKPKVKKKPIRRKKVVKKDFDIESLLLNNRQVLLYDSINEKSAKYIIERLIALDIVNKQPIDIWIHSGGGSTHAAFAIIETMKRIKSPVRTIINNIACSAAAMISIAGDERLAFTYSTWMQHPTAEWNDDYVHFVKDHMKFVDKREELVNDFHREYTKLTEKDIKKYLNGELWLIGDELKTKGIVDKIF